MKNEMIRTMAESKARKKRDKRKKASAVGIAGSTPKGMTASTTGAARKAAALAITLLMLLAAIAVPFESEAASVSPIKSYSSKTLLTKDGESFDLRAAAGQKMYGYDTLQGACANDGIIYYTLFNRDVNKCKIVKLDIATMEVIKVSGALPVYHANNLTYNTKKNILVATCCRPKGKRVVLIDPDTLKVTGKKTIKLNRKIPKSVRRKYKGFTAIAYNEKKNCYVGRLRDNNNVVIMNSNFKPVKYVKLKGKKTKLLNQGMESVGNYIYDVRSFKGKYKYNLVTIHTMSGKYVGKMKFPYTKSPGLELQCLFHDGNQFYVGFYYSTSQMDDTKKNKVYRYNQIYRLSR